MEAPVRKRLKPEDYLRLIEKSRVGKLKIYFGMCAGVGKTYAMLEAARRELAAGLDVVVGYVETHGRKETETLLEGLPLIPRRIVHYHGMELGEFDLDAALQRHPQLILVDELAHTNAPDSRHPKRYQDVLELVNAGIDVLTTLNVQHIESRAEVVRQIAGITVKETIPDTALEDAEFELVDLTPDELRARLAAGKVYMAERAATAQDHFFRPANLAALRELALRFAAEYAGQNVLAHRNAQGANEPWKSGQKLLVAVSSSPTSASLIRWTRRLAGELQSSWLAVFVELPRTLAEADKKRLSQNMALARDLGAEIITTTDEDFVRGVLRIAREQNVTQIIVGKPAGRGLLERLRGGSMLNRLIRDSGQIDIHTVRSEVEIIPAQSAPQIRSEKFNLRDYAWSIGVVAAVTAVNAILQSWLANQSLALLYLVSVVVLAMFVGRGATLLAATLTALSWDYFFTEPRFSLRITNSEDAMMFVTYFTVAVAMGQLTARLRTQQIAERQRERRATALYHLTRELAESPDLAQLLAVLIQHVGRAFQADVALSLPEESGPPTRYFASTWSLSEKEQAVAIWAFQHQQPAGRETDNLPSSEGLHLPLVAGERIAGVLSLRFHDLTPLLPPQRDLLEAFIRQIALVLDRQRLRDAEAQTRLLAESERLGTTLLNSVSHELRTPLAAISSVASGLRSTGSLNQSQQLLTAELEEAAHRLNRLVQNLLDLSRLEAGHLRPSFDWHDVRDIIRAALHSLGSITEQYKVEISVPINLPPVKLDAVLTEQILVNLFSNVAVHTPSGTTVKLRVYTAEQQLVLEMADNGPGLPAGDPMRLFDRFQRGPEAAAGSTGIGLSLVRGFAEAQRGVVSAENSPDGGAVFTVKLPLTAMPPLPDEINE
jgi:two-component system, OmpR family, sensor histidine kinase KdpD